MKRKPQSSVRIEVRLANAEDRESIYRLRHEVYVRELRQHLPNAEGSIRDLVDEFNVYIVTSIAGILTGFISVTPPGFGAYSLDKYVCRENFPELCSDKLFEIRLLTAVDRFRRRETAGLLMYAALRWIEAQGGEQIVALGRREVLGLYLRVGLEKLGHRFRSGSVRYELLSGTASHIRARIGSLAPLLNRLERYADWQLEFPFKRSVACFHGGAFFDAIGVEFDNLGRRDQIINADVLDAWFPPSPNVMIVLKENLPWLLRTSPPADSEGLVRVISRVRGIQGENLLPVAGSSDGIFLALRHWLRTDSRVLILDPTYGEYPHVLEQVIGCRVDRFPLSRERNYQPDLAALAVVAGRGYDLIVMVNPGSPTGGHVPGKLLLHEFVAKVPERTLVWIDETYVDYVSRGESLEFAASQSRNLIVCKSMSKVYALSGARVGYLCGPVGVIDTLRGLNPPWAVSLPAQVAAVAALQDHDYYDRRHAETRRLRQSLASALDALPGWQTIPGAANFLLCHLPETGVDAQSFAKHCRAHGLFVRDASGMGRRMGRHALRIAVKDAETNVRMLAILGQTTQALCCAHGTQLTRRTASRTPA